MRMCCLTQTGNVARNKIVQARGRLTATRSQLIERLNTEVRMRECVRTVDTDQILYAKSHPSLPRHFRLQFAEVGELGAAFGKDFDRQLCTLEVLTCRDGAHLDDERCERYVQLRMRQSGANASWRRYHRDLRLLLSAINTDNDNCARDIAAQDHTGDPHGIVRAVLTVRRRRLATMHFECTAAVTLASSWLQRSQDQHQYWDHRVLHAELKGFRAEARCRALQQYYATINNQSSQPALGQVDAELQRDITSADNDQELEDDGGSSSTE
jgi:hypothetical protein